MISIKQNKIYLQRVINTIKLIFKTLDVFRRIAEFLIFALKLFN